MCEKWIMRANARVKIVTENDANHISEIVNKTAAAGDALCTNYRICVSKKRKSYQKTHSLSDNEEDTTFELDLNRQEGAEEQAEEEFVELPIRMVVATHRYCLICRNANGTVARKQCYTRRQLYIPKGYRCCKHHLIKDRFFEEEMSNLKPQFNTSHITISEITEIMEDMAIRGESAINGGVGNKMLTEKQLIAFTGFGWDAINELTYMMKSMRNTSLQYHRQ